MHSTQVQRLKFDLNKTSKPLIMGILNVTPDSFSDGGNFLDTNAALQQAAAMAREGANIIDIGGESTRPGSDPVAAEEQINRVIPVITAIRKLVGDKHIISIDTTSALVAEAAITAGAEMINDVSGGLDDPAMFNLVAHHKLPYVLMHCQGKPKTMQDNPYYADVVPEVIAFLKERAELALAAGVDKSQIILDPGIGFGKRRQDNLALLAHLGKLVALGFPILLGTSRKRFMGAILETTEPAGLVTATAVTTALGVMAGVKVFRVHDIKENRQALEVAWAIKNSNNS